MTHPDQPISTRQWTQDQERAIAHEGGDVLVSAAAGSGKTAVLAERCARLVCESREVGGGGAERTGVENLLVLTFTDAAANEMKNRIAAAIRGKIQAALNDSPEDLAWLRRQAAMVDRASISTLHAFCARVLRAHFHEAQIDPGFEIIDSDEAALLREEVLDELLAKMHRLPASPEAAAFTDFFEAYADGREDRCRRLILLLYEMLASTAKPEEFLANARAVYAGAGAATFAAYLKDVVCERLRLAVMTAQRAAAVVGQVVGPGKMLGWLEQMVTLLQWAQGELRAKGTAAWVSVRESLNCEWQDCVNEKRTADFAELKKHTWFAVKRKMEDLQFVTLAADPVRMQSELAPLAAPLESLIGLAQSFDAAYTAAKQAQNRLDFHDLERRTLNLLTAAPLLGNRAVQELQARYHHVLVDEYQDINPLQEALLNSVRSGRRFGGRGNLFLVGDVKQSIYGFRLADPGQFLKREGRSRGDDSAGGGLIALQENFRSQPRLLSAMNGLFERLLTPEIARVNYPDGHTLKPGARGDIPPSPRPFFDGSPVELHLITMKTRAQEEQEETKKKHPGGRGAGGGEAEDELDSIDREPPPENLSAVEYEARMVADRIAELLENSQHNGRGIRRADGSVSPATPRDIAILLRGMKNKGMIFARALARRGIAAHAELGRGYFDTPEIRDTLALLHVLDNPRQDIHLATVLLGPYGNFSHDDLALIRLTFSKTEVPFADAVAKYPDGAAAIAGAASVIGVHELSADAPPFSAELADRLRQFFLKLESWRGKLLGRPLHEGLAEIYTESKILVYVAGLEAGVQRVANLQMLHQRALRFGSFRKQGLHRFLRFLEKLRDQEADSGEAPVLSDASDVVRIMSIHKAKGLEFPIVFVCGLGTRLLLGKHGPVYVDRDLGIGLDVVDIPRNVVYPSAAGLRIAERARRADCAEELRLLYVAMTRARDHLVLTGHIEKESSLDALARQWKCHAGPLPEDLLLKGSTPLDWILPALSCGGTPLPPAGAANAQPAPLAVAWNNPDSSAQVSVTLHAPGAAARRRVDSVSEEQARRADSIRLGQPLAQGVVPDPGIAGLISRVRGTYPHAATAARAAVQTVSFLKTLRETQSPDAEAEPVPAAELASLEFADDSADLPRDPTAAQNGRLRGTATHRVLELLDLRACDSAAAVTAQVDRLVRSNRLSSDERGHADLGGIQWLLLESEAGQRLRAAAQGPSKINLRREIPFTWTGPITDDLASADPADWPTVRGVIDALLVNPESPSAELFDYKTDAAFLWQSRLEDYSRQMRYYLRAASDILGFPISRATLLFLSPKIEHEVVFN